MYCVKCGSPITEGGKFCSKCGSPVAHHISGETQQPVAESIPVPNAGGERYKCGHLHVWLWVLGAALIIIPGIIALVLFFVDIINTPSERYVFPGTHEIQFDDTGEYTVYYEYQSTVDGVAYLTSEDIPDLQVMLQSKDDLERVEIESASFNESYSYGSRAGKSLFEFDIDEPGVYILTAEYQDGSSTPDIVLAVRESLDIIGIMLRSLFIGLGGFILGVIVILLGILKWHTTRQKMAAFQAISISPKSRLAVTLLAFFLGQLGIHRFYLEKYKTAVLMLLTCGGLGVWALIDFILAVSGEMTDAEGRLITRWQS